MVIVTKEGIILRKSTLGFENEGVLNPAIMQEGNTVHLFYRAVSTGNHSTIGYCQLEGPLNVIRRDVVPLLMPDNDTESKGMEDPRIVHIEGLYYLTYTAYDGWNALGSLAVSSDMKTFTRKGPIVPEITYDRFLQLVEPNKQVNRKYLRFRPLAATHPSEQLRESLMWDKNVVLFPRKIDGKFVFLHRIRPDIQLVSVNAFEELTPAFWEDYLLHLPEHIVMQSEYKHEISFIGGGCPPIECAAGWVVIYHGVYDTPTGFVYSACAALLDLHNPLNELARLPKPLFTPEHRWETEGYVNNVCFPTGTALFDDTLYIYYGAADEQIACASLIFSTLIDELVSLQKPH